jgi:hypothetical protein
MRLRMLHSPPRITHTRAVFWVAVLLLMSTRHGAAAKPSKPDQTQPQRHGHTKRAARVCGSQCLQGAGARVFIRRPALCPWGGTTRWLQARAPNHAQQRAGSEGQAQQAQLPPPCPPYADKRASEQARERPHGRPTAAASAALSCRPGPRASRRTAPLLLHAPCRRRRPCALATPRPRRPPPPPARVAPPPHLAAFLARRKACAAARRAMGTRSGLHDT